MTPSVARALRILLMAGCVWALERPHGGPSSAAAQTESPSGSRPAPAEEAAVRRIFVPANRPSLWPEGDWQAISGEEFQARLKSLPGRRVEPRTARIVRAEYSATFVEDTLRGGEFTAEVSRAGDRAELLPLDPLNAAVSDLRWTDEKAIWGATPDGRTALWVDRRQGRLHGRWSLRGHALPRSVEFDLRLAPAAASRLRLRLPEGHELSASAGRVSGPQPADQAGWTQWRVDLGSTTQCRLTVSRRRAPLDLSPLVLARSEVSCAVQQEGLRLQAQFQLEVLQAPVNRLTFRVPADLQIYSVSYGSDVTLPWTSNDGDGRQRIVVELPDGLQGQSRPIRLRAFGDVPIGREWTLPQFRLADAVLLDSRFHLNVVSPLQVRSVRPVGFRQTSTVSAADEESLTFQQFRSDGRLVIRVGPSEQIVAARAVTHLAVDAESWSLTSRIHWNAQSGSRYNVRCAVPAGWKVTRVRVRGGDSGWSVPDWTVTAGSGGRRLLAVELRDALTPQTPRTLEISCQRTAVDRGRAGPLPVPRPLDCRSSESLLVVSHSAATVPRVGGSSSYRSIRPADAPEFARNSQLWEEIDAEADRTTAFLWATAPADGATLALENLESPLKARIRMDLTLDGDRLIEKLSGVVTPLAGSVDHVWIYVSTTGAAWNWTLDGGADKSLSAQRVPLAPSRRNRWDLPESGELWRLRLPGPQTGPFRITAQRSQTAFPVLHPALAFVPTAQPFEGTLVLRIGEGAEAELDAEGLRPRPPGTGPRAPQAARRSTSPDRRFWSYRDPGAELTLRIHDDNFPAAGPRAHLQLQSLIAAAPGGHDLHRATFRLGPRDEQTPFRFTLPRPAEMVGVRLDDRSVTPLREDGGFVLPALPEEETHTVEIRYRTPAAGGWLRQSRRVVLPRSRCCILGFEWTVAHPPELRLAGAPEPMVLRQRLPRLSWSERLFGPLGAAESFSLFNPFSLRSWQHLGAAETTGPSEPPPDRDRRFAPPDWIVRRGAAPHQPEVVRLEAWNASHARQLGWLTLLATLLAGGLVKIGGFRVPATWIGSGLAICAVAAWLVPPWSAQPFGGLLAGAVVSLALPRRFLIARRAVAVDSEQPAQESTQTFHGPLGTGLFLLVGCLAVRGLAQEPASSSAPASRPEAVEGDRRPFEVLIPFDPAEPPGGESSTPPVVYVPRSFLDESDRHGRPPEAMPDYLISSADYRATVTPQNTVQLEARFRIAVPAGRDTARVALPLDGAHLLGPGACLVDGRRRPVMLAPDGDGIRIEVSRPGRRDASRRDAVSAPRSHPPAEGPSGEPSESASPVPARAPEPVETVEVVLKFSPQTVPAETVPGGRSFRMAIPPVADSRLSVAFQDEAPTVDVAEVRGAVTIVPSRSLTAELGRADELRVLWSSNEEPIQRPATLEAEVAALVTVHPTRLEYRCFVDYHVLQGSVDFIFWQLPREMLLRDVSADRLRDVSLSPINEDQSRLLADFSAPQTGDFLVEAVFTVPLPQAGNSNSVRIPAVDFFGVSAETEAVRVTRNRVGVASTSQLELTPRADQVEAARSISAETFLKTPAVPEGIRAPSYAYELSRPTSLGFEWIPVRPHRIVRKHQRGTVGPRRLNWTVEAEIETTAAAFRHRLVVDPELQIESVSLQEDGVERLSRWTRVGDTIHLFLKDRTTGSQTLLLQANRPLELGEKVALPSVRFEDAEAAESRLTLSRDPAVSVDLIGFENLETTSAPEESGTDGDQTELLGRYRLSGSEKPLQIRPVAGRSGTEIDSVTQLERREPGRWRFTALFRARGFDSPKPEIRLRVPAEWGESLSVARCRGGPPVTVRRRGTSEIIVSPAVEVTGDFPFQASAMLARPASGPWTLPHVEFINAANGRHHLWLSAPRALAPAAPSARSMPTERLPSWALEAAGTDPQAEGVRLFRGESLPWTLEGLDQARRLRDPAVPLLETHLWWSPGAGLFGRTDLLVRPAGSRRLDLSWPAGAELRAASVDGTRVGPRFVSTNAERSNKPRQQLALPMNGSSSWHWVTVRWKEPAGPAPRVMGRVGWNLPHPRGIAVGRHLLTVVSPADSRVVSRSGLSVAGATDYGLDRLDALLDTVRAISDRGTPPSELLSLVRDLRDRIERRISAGKAGTTAADQRRQARFRELSQALAELTEGLPESGEDGNRAGFVLDRAAVPGLIDPPNRTALRGHIEQEDPAAGVSAWVYDGKAARRAGGIAVLLVLLLIVPLIGRRVPAGTGEWLQRHPAVSIALLGLLWWGCFRAGWIGVLLILLAPAVAMGRYGSRLGRRPEGTGP